MKIRIVLAAMTLLPMAAMAQPADQPKAEPNPKTNHYVEVPGFFKLPAGRSMGSSSAVMGDSKGNIWVVDRCAANSCVGSKLDPVMEFDAKGNFVKSFGAGLLQFAHGFTIDSKDHLWITDGVPPGAKDAKGGHVVLEFDASGKLLRTMGKPGVPAMPPDGFTEPNAVLIAPDGSIFVAQNHTNDYKGQPRVMKFSADGKFIKEWGTSGKGPGEFGMPHCLALDSKGNLYVGDRDNNRIQIFTQDGKLLGQLTQFGRPSGIVIDRNDVMYVTDSESTNKDGYGHNPGWQRGIRIGSVKDGVVTDFIPDPDSTMDTTGTSAGEGVWADGKGAVYSAEVKQKAILKYVKR